MKSKNKLKQEFKEFFKKHPLVTKLPFLVTVVIPRYECKGERLLWEFDRLMEDEDNFKNLVSSPYTDIDSFYEDVFQDIPQISEKDAFYLFDEDNLIMIHNEEKGVRIEVVDYSSEVNDSY